jgi:hypothetical protein
MTQNDPFQPFNELDFEELIKPEHWTETSALHTPTLEAALDAHAETLTLRFSSGHEEMIQRSDLEALTRYLIDHAHVEPLPPVDESIFEDFQPRRVDL